VFFKLFFFHITQVYFYLPLLMVLLLPAVRSWVEFRWICS